ncbi:MULTISPECIES: DeoR/GlpR family DNA-binding transcription regulator [Glutamicibacter]
MFAEERQQAITELLASAGKVTVADLAQRFEITRETVRRDLDQLEQLGSLRRVHGGAVSTLSSSTREESHLVRSTLHADDKARIARAAFNLIPAADTSILLDAGSSTGLLAELIAQSPSEHQHLLITHALPIATSISANPELPIEFIGGRIRGLTGAASGSRTVAELDGLSADIAFVGTNAIDPSFGLSTPDPMEADVKRAIVAAAKRVVVLADASKFNERSLVRFAELAEIDTLITTGTPDASLASALADADVEVLYA